MTATTPPPYRRATDRDQRAARGRRASDADGGLHVHVYSGAVNVTVYANSATTEEDVLAALARAGLIDEAAT